MSILPLFLLALGFGLAFATLMLSFALRICGVRGTPFLRVGKGFLASAFFGAFFSLAFSLLIWQIAGLPYLLHPDQWWLRGISSVLGVVAVLCTFMFCFEIGFFRAFFVFLVNKLLYLGLGVLAALLAMLFFAQQFSWEDIQSAIEDFSSGKAFIPGALGGNTEPAKLFHSLEEDGFSFERKDWRTIPPHDLEGEGAATPKDKDAPRDYHYSYTDKEGKKRGTGVPPEEVPFRP